MDIPKLTLTLLAVAAGGGIALQFAVNAQLGRVLGNPLAASVISFIAGLLALSAATFVFARRLPPIAAIREAPSYVFYVGGLCGALFVVTAIVVTPKIGTAATLTLAILGQLLAALVIDHFGLFATPPHQISAGRLLGAALVVAGAFMVRIL